MRKPLSRRRSDALLGLGQDLLILVLVVSAVMLAGGSGLLDFAGDISGGVLGMQSGQNQGGQKEYTAAAEPLSMMLTPEAGAHCGVMYSQEELYSAYDRFFRHPGRGFGLLGRAGADKRGGVARRAQRNGRLLRFLLRLPAFEPGHMARYRDKRLRRRTYGAAHLHLAG